MARKQAKEKGSLKQNLLFVKRTGMMTRMNDRMKEQKSGIWENISEQTGFAALPIKV